MLIAAALLAGCSALGSAPLGAPLVHQVMVSGDSLTLRSEPWFAGAVSSIRYRGVEYVDSADHGRLLQGAIAFDAAFECLNPTQAGASSDHPRRTTSRLLSAEVAPKRYSSTTRMAYWLRPGQTCATGTGGRALARNPTRLSQVTYGQTHTFGHRGLDNVVLDEITFTTAAAHPGAVVEALTLYAPAAFDRVYLYDPSDGSVRPDLAVQAAPGEQPLPVVLATADGRNAFALLSLTEGAAYGRWTLPTVSKINLVFRPPGEYPAGVHTYRCVWIIGTLAEVHAALDASRAWVGEETGPARWAPVTPSTG